MNEMPTADFIDSFNENISMNFDQQFNFPGQSLEL